MDYCLITTTSNLQAQIFQSQISKRIEHGIYPKEIEFRVYADPKESPIGNGGATLYALLRLLQEVRVESSPEEFLHWNRILIIHAGGTTQHLPCFGMEGKLFTPIPVATGSVFPPVLLDAQISFFLKYPWLNGEVVVTLGDTYLNGTIQVPNRRKGLWAFVKSLPIHNEHPYGIYEIDSVNDEVVNYFPKNSVALESLPLKPNFQNQYMTDLGVLSLSPNITTELLQLCFSGKKYSDFGKKILNAQVRFTLFNELIRGAVQSEIKRFNVSDKKFNQKKAWGFTPLEESNFQSILNNNPIHVSEWDQVSFFHLGNLAQISPAFLNIVHFPPALFYQYGKDVVELESAKDIVSFNSSRNQCYQHRASVVFLESCERVTLTNALGNNILVRIKNLQFGFELPYGICLEGFSKDDYQYIACYGVSDTFDEYTKANQILFCGVPLDAWCKARNLKLEDLFPKKLEGKFSLLDARLYTSWKDDSFIQGYWEVSYDPQWSQKFRESKRISLSELQKNLSIEAKEEIRIQYRRELLKSNLVNKKNWTSMSQADFKEIKLTPHEQEELSELARNTSVPLLKSYRFQMLSLSGVKKSIPAERPSKEISPRKIALSKTSSPPHHFVIKPSQKLVVHCPARLDLAGGWTDTLPYAQEFGGEVLNLGVQVGHQWSHMVSLEVIDQPVVDILDAVSQTSIRIHKEQDWESKDLVAKGFHWIIQCLKIFQVDKFILAKKRLNISRGLKISVFCPLPLGSGLGTASLLHATLLTGLSKILGQNMDGISLVPYLLEVQNKLGVNGGWQDALGGWYGGLKYMSSSPSNLPSPQIHYLDTFFFENSQYQQNFTLFYSEKKRPQINTSEIFSQTVLRKIPASLYSLEILKKNAREMKVAVETRDFEAFADCLNRTRVSGEYLNPGMALDSLEEFIRGNGNHVLAHKYLGAGGGGFVLLISPSIKEAVQLRLKLGKFCKTEGGKIYPFSIDKVGVEVSLF